MLCIVWIGCEGVCDVCSGLLMVDVFDGWL